MPPHERGLDDSNNSFTHPPQTPCPKSFEHPRNEPFQSFFHEDRQDESTKIENNRNTPSPKLTSKEKVIWDLKAKRRKEYDASLRSAGIEPDEDDSGTESESESDAVDLPGSAKTSETLEALRKRWAEKLALNDSIVPQ